MQHHSVAFQTASPIRSFSITTFSLVPLGIREHAFKHFLDARLRSAALAFIDIRSRRSKSTKVDSNHGFLNAGERRGKDACLYESVNEWSIDRMNEWRRPLRRMYKYGASAELTWSVG